MSSNTNPSNPVLALRKAALAAMPKGPLPCAAVGAGKRVEIYDPREGKTKRLNPYGAAAKQLYKYYIQELGFDETWIAPLDLDFQPSSGALHEARALEAETARHGAQRIQGLPVLL